MVLALEKKWIWDSWYAKNGDDWHAYFLQADKTLINPDYRHWYVSQGHAVSKDLKTWTHKGTCFAPSVTPSWDDYTTWTGSVVQGTDGVWHLFYTGTTKAENGMKQRIGHATSTDMHSWERVGNGQCLDISGTDYEEYSPGHWHDRAFRDPWVIKNPDGDGWFMYFTARVPGVEEPNGGGAVGFATSPDLYTWTLQAPVYSGGTFGQLEVPQVFEKNGKWYCLFCTSASHWSQAYKAFNPQTPVTGTHYLIADSARGPWTVAPGDFLDGAEPCRRYAARIVDTADGLQLLGFMANPEGEPFIGAISDPAPIVIDENGLLKQA